jgi:hypothetical protein
MNFRGINNSVRSIALLFMFGAVVSGYLSAPAPFSPALSPTPGAYWPTGGWRTSTPEEQGFELVSMYVLPAVQVSE